MTRWPPAASRRATTKPSPPLFPVPHRTTVSSRSASGPPGPITGSARRASSVKATSATAAPALSISASSAQAEALGRLIDLRHLGRADEDRSGSGLSRRRGRGSAGARIGHSSVIR